MYSQILIRLLPLIFLFSTLQAETLLVVERECKRIAGKLASVGYRECLDRKLSVSDGLSVKDAPILVKDYPAYPEKLNGKVLLVGGIHGDEYSTVTIVFKWMTLLEDNNAGLFHWRIVPLLNPDGLLQERSEKLNANGRDLDRSFPVGDDSAPETKWLIDNIQSFRPDVIITLHAPHEIVDYSALEGKKYELQRLTAKRPGLKEGTLNQYAASNNIPVLTVELPYADIMPTPAEVKTMWQDVNRWIRNQTKAR